MWSAKHQLFAWSYFMKWPRVDQSSLMRWCCNSGGNGSWHRGLPQNPFVSLWPGSWIEIRRAFLCFSRAIVHDYVTIALSSLCPTIIQLWDSAGRWSPTADRLHSWRTVQVGPRDSAARALQARWTLSLAQGSVGSFTSFPAPVWALLFKFINQGIWLTTGDFSITF